MPLPDFPKTENRKPEIHISQQIIAKLQALRKAAERWQQLWHSLNKITYEQI